MTNANGPDKVFYTVPEVCEWGRFCPATFFNLAKAGKLKVCKIGRRTLVHKDELKRFADALNAA